MWERIRPLDPDAVGVPSWAGIPVIRLAARSECGTEKVTNEDSVFLFQSSVLYEGAYLPVGLAVLADGLGGYGWGDLASEMAVRIVGEKVIRGCILPMLTREEKPPINQVLSEAVAAANTAILRVAGGRAMAATLTAALILNRMVYLVHLGDSRAYVISKSAMRKLTRDHTVAQRLLDLGQPVPDQSRHDSELGALYKALGRYPIVEPDATSQDLSEASVLLLCSDGIWKAVEEERIAEIVGSSADPEEVCERLVRSAKMSGSTDDMTAIVAAISGENRCDTQS